MSLHKKLVLVALALSLTSVAAVSKTKIRIAKDHFPTGQETPEGAASDFARVFIRRDVLLLQHIAIRPYSGGSSREEYVRFLSGMSEQLKRDRASGTRDPKNPIKILTVFAARHFSKEGPSSYGYSAFGFQDLMFVDVEVSLNDGRRYTNRTMVIKDKDGRWYVHPAPYVSPLLSNGLDSESVSKQTFSQVYDVSP